MRLRRSVGVATSVLFLLMAGGTAHAGVGQWDFTSDLSPSAGSGTLSAEGGTVTHTTAVINGRTADVASFTNGTILRMAHGLSPNGGGSYVNQYTLIMDVMFPDTATAGYVSLWQTATSNGNDGDWFIKNGSGIGISGTYGGDVADGEWHRLALVVDLEEGTLTSYVNGEQAMHLTLADEDALTLDGRWSLDPEALVLADNDGETAAGLIDSLQIRDEALSATVIAGLGGPSGLGLPPPIEVEFEQPDGPPVGWPTYGVGVTVTGEVLTLTPSGAESGAILGEGGQGLWIDRIARIEAEVSFPGNTTAWPYDHGGIFFCAQSPAGRYSTTCYVIDYLAKDAATPQLGRFRLAKFNNGAEQALTETPQTITEYEGTWVIELTETEIVFTFNDEELIRYPNADLSGGFMGFWAYQGAANSMAVDDVKITYARASCPGFVTTKVSLTTGKDPQLALVHIPTRANFVAPYECTISSAEPSVAAPVGHTNGALDVVFDVGDPAIGAIEIEPGGPGETTLGLSVDDADCSGVSTFVETLGLFAYEETFTQADGPPEGWYIASQSAQVISEELSLTRGTADPFVWYAVGGQPLSVGKMESLSCKIRFARTTNTSIGCHGGMVLAPAVTAARGQGYMIDVIERASDNGYRIYKDNNAAVQLGGPRQPFVWDDQFHEWKITFTPTGFTFSVDGVQLADVADLTYRGGFLSFWCYTGANAAPQGQNMFVDDIRIEFGSTYCSQISPSVASNRPVNPMTEFTVTAPFGSNLTSDYELTVTSSDPAVAVPFGGTEGSLVLTFPQGGILTQTFEAECLAPGTTEFLVSSEGAICPNSYATFTVPEPGLPEYCDQFEQADGAPEGWTPYTGTWQVVDEKLTVSCAAGSHTEAPADQTWIWAGNPPVKFEGAATYEFSVDLTQTTADAVGRHGGIMLFGSAPTFRGLISGYDIDWIDRVDDHGFRFLRYDSGVATVLVNGTPDVAEPGSIWLVEVDGENIRVYSDGALVLDVVDARYREGYFGFWTYCNTTTAAFDNFGVGLDCMAPTASFTATPTEGVPPLEVALDASESADNVGIVSYDWDFGDGATGTGEQTTHTYTADGTYTAVLTVADAAGYTATAEVVITLETPGGRQKPMDFNQDGAFDLSDSVSILNFLFLGGAAPPCGDGSIDHPGNQALLNANGDAAIDLSDAVYALNYLFLGGPPPVMCDGTCACFLIIDCPDNANCP